MKRFVLFLILFAFALHAQSNVDQRVRTLLSQMTLEEKVGQMTQITLSALSDSHDDLHFTNHLNMNKLKQAVVDYHVGSILNTGGSANSARNWREMITTIQKLAVNQTRLGIPVIYGIDAIHGANYIKEGTLFPQSIAMAATWNRELVRKAASITAKEIKAVGIPWDFNPVLGLARQPLWPRFWETFGEDSYAASEFARAYVQGMEENTNVAACMKHYLGYSVPRSGHDRTPAELSERTVREWYLPPFQAAVEAGVKTVMINSSEISGVPLHASYHYLTEVLRNELGFTGLAVSDWADIENLYKREKVAANRREAVKMAVMAGVDMSMVPMDFSFYDTLLELVNDGEVPVSRIDQAVARILRVKFQLGLFEHPFPPKTDLKEIGRKQNGQVSLDAAREAIILLKNTDNILPLKNGQKILVCGPSADLHQSLNGGWTYTWQGNREELFPKNQQTIVQAIRERAGKENVLYTKGTSFTSVVKSNEVYHKAHKADVIVACMGEPAYCETPGNINDLNLSDAQVQFIHDLRLTKKPIVLVLTEGRPRIIRKIEKRAKAVVLANLPGPMGSRAISEVLFGDINPSGRLPFTYPRYANDLVPYDHKTSAETKPVTFNPQYPFGAGLSYTNFEYSHLQLDRDTLHPNETLTVSVQVKNTGKRAGKHTVFLFLSDKVRSVTPPVKQLKGFDKIELKAGESKTVRFLITPQDLTFIGRNNRRISEAGQFDIHVGNVSASFEYNE